MNIILRNVIAVVLGLVLGGLVNFGLIMLSGYVIPPPAGADISTYEGLRESIHLFQPKHFLFPFLAHALGTLVGAVVSTKIAATRHFAMAMIVGVLFLAGSATNVAMLPAPMWFNVVDLVGAYIPMAWIGYRLASR